MDKGLYYRHKTGKILVVDPVPKSFQSSGGIEEFYNAIWFSNAPKNAKVGQKVQVWFENVLTSYPGQSEAKRVVIISSTKPKSAVLSEDEVIRKALQKHKSDFTGVTIIKQVNYNESNHTWNVDYAG